MNANLPIQHASSPLWRLARGQTLQLPVTRAARWLRLREGELWLTAAGRADAPPPEDWWLSPGECLRLPAGTAVLAEGWAAASFELLEEPEALPAGPSRRPWRSKAPGVTALDRSASA